MHWLLKLSRLNVTAGAPAAATVAVATAAAAATAATTVAALASLDQPLNLCVAKKSRDSNASSPMLAARQNPPLAKTGGKKGKQISNIIISNLYI